MLFWININNWSIQGANGPTTPEADAILLKNNVLVIPGILNILKTRKQMIEFCLF